MKQILKKYLDVLFAPYSGNKTLEDIKTDILQDLEEHYNDLKEKGLDDETAYLETINTIGDIRETIDINSLEPKRLAKQNFSGSNLGSTNFINVLTPNTSYNGSIINNCDFSEADLSGSSFSGSDISNTIFDGALLTNTKFSASDLKKTNFSEADLSDAKISACDMSNAIFNKSILTRTNFSATDLARSKFTNVNFIDTHFAASELKKVVFDNCKFIGVEFKYSDLRNQCFDNLYFEGVTFNKTTLAHSTFNNSTIINCAFASGFGVSKKYYRDIQAINFDGAKIDRVTHAALKGFEANLTNVTII